MSATREESPRYARPRPVITPVTRPFWEAARRHELRLQKCADCGHVNWPIGPVCQSCWSKRLSWEPMSGKGRLHSWVRFHKAYLPGFEDNLPYPVALVELVEGPRLISHIKGLDYSKFRSGLELTVDFDDVAADLTLPVFRPLASA